MKSAKPKPNWHGWIQWRKLYNKIVLSCCDCGLAHTFEFKSDGKILWWRAKRNREQTKLNKKSAKNCNHKKT